MGWQRFGLGMALMSGLLVSACWVVNADAAAALQDARFTSRFTGGQAKFLWRDFERRGRDDDYTNLKPLLNQLGPTNKKLFLQLQYITFDGIITGGPPRGRQVNTAKHRTHSLFRQGVYFYDALPWMKDEPLQRLFSKFGELLYALAFVREVFGLD